MPSMTTNILDRLAGSGPRLPGITSWMSEDIWSAERYASKSASDYLTAGEKAVNELEEVIAAAAGRVYDELLTPSAPERNLRDFLVSQQPCAAVVFDGMSLREVPLILQLAEKSGLRVVERGWATAAIPSETVDFVAQRLGVGTMAPSQLHASAELRNLGIAAYHLDQVNQQRQLDPAMPAILLWSAFPDYRYKERDAKFVEMFEHMHNMMMTAWQNSVQEFTRQAPGRKILVTSDHGYVFLGPGCSLPWDNNAIRPLTAYLGGDRCARLSEKPNPPDHRGLAVYADRDVAVLRGRVQTHPPGDAARRLYKHGGLSLMEMLTPWIVLEGAV